MDFEVADISGVERRGFEAMLANGVIQWIPDHERFLPTLIGKLALGGSLAVQAPDNLDEPSHHRDELTWLDRPQLRSLLMPLEIGEGSVTFTRGR